MKLAAVSLFAAALCAGAALAQPAASPPPAVQTPAPPGKAPATGAKTLEGLTVRPIPKRGCLPRDKECIALVVAELKQRYPEQLKRFCFQREMRAMNNSVLFGDVDPASGEPAQLGATYRPADALRVACAPDKK
ncbi:MAG TPA: hypothetical protein VIE16_10135 [Phenylobacterium sp.]|jgi:hypothetical protein